MGIRAIDERLCTGCGICADDCPMDVIRMDQERKKATVAYPHDCMVCYLCEIACPEEAIEVSPEVVKKLFFPY